MATGRSADLVARWIRSAFAATPAPPPGRLLRETSRADPEAVAVATALGRTCWSEVSATTIHGCRAGLPFLSPAGFRYYLPAYLLACLSTPELRDVVLVDLCPPPDTPPWSPADFEARRRALSPDQRHAVLAFLDHLQAGETGTSSWTPRPEPLSTALTAWGAVPER
jgi:hypothetical protein